MKKVIGVFWNVFGYAFVGFISLIYGLILQIHNYEIRFKELFWNENDFMIFYIVIMIIMILLNLLFSHAYATLYVNVYAGEGEKQANIYVTLGHWLETVILIIVIAYLIPAIVRCKASLYVLIMVVVLCGHWCVCTGYYRTYLMVNKRKYIEDKSQSPMYDTIKYKLIIPAMLMIASNIYMASCIGEMWDGKLEYVGLMVLLDVFILGYTIVDFILDKSGVSITIKSELMPIFVFFALLVCAEAVNLYVAQHEKIGFFDTPMRSLFLASFVAVYLAMFEGWFVIKGVNSISDRVIKQGINLILVYMPAIVCCLFPFQDFELIYFIFFLIGHNYARWYWLNSQNISKNKCKNLAFMRAVLGTITLIVLIIDKKHPIYVDDVLGNLINTETVGSATIALTLLEIILCIVPLRRFSLKKIKRSVLTYFLTVIFLAMVMYVGKSAPIERIFLSITGMLVFIIFECYIFNSNIEKEGEKKGEAK